MQYAFFGTATSESLDRFAKLVGAALEGVGFTSADGNADEANLVISLLDLEDPKPFRRRGKGSTRGRCGDRCRRGWRREETGKRA